MFVPAKWLFLAVGAIPGLLGGVWIGSSSWTGNAYKMEQNAKDISDLKIQTVKDIEDEKKNVIVVKDDVMRVIEILRHDLVTRNEKSDADVTALRNSLNEAAGKLNLIDLKLLYLSREIPPAAPSLPGVRR